MELLTKKTWGQGCFIVVQWKNKEQNGKTPSRTGRCSEVNSAWLITSELANYRARKALFTCVVYTISTGLKITVGHRTMSGEEDYLSGQNLGLAFILTGHVSSFQTITRKIICFIFEKYKQLNHKISQQLVVTK